MSDTYTTFDDKSLGELLSDTLIEWKGMVS